MNMVTGMSESNVTRVKFLSSSITINHDLIQKLKAFMVLNIAKRRAHLFFLIEQFDLTSLKRFS